MSLTLWCILLFAGGVVLILAELGLPAHGLLGVLGAALIAGAIGIGFYVAQWIGLTMLVAMAVASPIVMKVALNIWPRTPFGRRVMLQPIESTIQPPHVGLGQVGVAVSELRPMGYCEFDDARHEVKSEIGVIHAGSKVKVVSIDAGRLIVRTV